MSDTPTSDDPYELDAPFEIKDSHITDGFSFSAPTAEGVDDLEPTTSTAGPVVFPGDASANAAGSRAIDHGEHNWRYAGPRNVGGRVVALAVDTNRPAVMYAGAASGGVFKSVDSGATWFPLWFDEAALPVGAIDIVPSVGASPEVVWVGTGEVSAGGGEVIRGDGIYRSDDGGQTWSRSGVPGSAGTDPGPPGYSIDAVAADPTNNQICYAVGPAGVFRTTNGGAAWTQFANTAGTNFSDAKYSVALTPPHAPILFLVRGTSPDGSTLVVRLDNPGAADAAVNTALTAAAGQMQVTPPAALANNPSRGKLAVGFSTTLAAGARDTVYVTFAHTGSAHFGLFRCQTARQPNASTAVWSLLNPHGNWGTAFEGQANYNLSLAVDRANVNNIATGMIETYVSTNANGPLAAVQFNQASSWRSERPAHHSDHHASLFVQRLPAPAPSDLWQGHDGGLSRSTNWSSGVAWLNNSFIAPIAPGFIDWEKRDRGFHATQFYDIAQSPLQPSLFGGGMQDNGVFVTDGGGTWLFVLGADGGFVAFDPDDPYRFLATWQNDAAAIEFPGDLDGKLPLPSQGTQAAFWPRILRQGFRAADKALFVSDAAYDPFDTGRVLIAREPRLYGQRLGAAGEAWSIEQVGSGIELQVSGIAGGLATLEIKDSSVARALHVLPHVTTATRVGEPARLFIRGDGSGAFDLRGARELEVNVNGVPQTLTIRDRDVRERRQVTVKELATALDDPAAGVWAGPIFPQRPWGVEIYTERIGTVARPASIALGGTAVGLFLRTANTYTSAAGSPAVVRVPAFLATTGAFVDASTVAPAAPLTLTLAVNGGPVRTLTFTTPAFADLSSLRVGELLVELRRVLADDDVIVSACQNRFGWSINRAGGGAVTFTGQPTVGPAFGFRNQFTGGIGPRDWTGFTQLSITDGVNTANVAVASPPFFNPAQVWSDELATVLNAAAVANSVQARVTEGSGYNTHPRGSTFYGPTEIQFSPDTPGRIWVGGMAGTVFSTDDQGATWTTRTDQLFQSQDRRVEAIAFHPTNSSTIYLGLYGERKDLAVRPRDEAFQGAGANDPGFLFRSTDGGDTWQHVGAQVVDSANNLQSINALEVDPSAPQMVYAATNVGVFRSDNGGTSWETFNQGLPNVWIRDMVMERRTRTLRVSAWGRGIYERHVGDREAKNVELFIRASELDQGIGRPAPRGTAPFAQRPEFAASQSPDIKVTRTLPPRLAAAGVLIDGVDFDTEVTNEPVVAGAADVLVQVHNRGPDAADQVHIATFWADATSGTPDLPDNFWEDLGLASILAGLPATMGSWNLIGEHTIVDPPVPANFPPTGYDKVTNEMPRVHRFTTNFPAAVDAMTSIAVMAIVSSPRDGPAYFSVTERNVAKALDLVQHLGVRHSRVLHTADDAQMYLRSVDASSFAITGGTPAIATQLGLAAGPAAPILVGGTQPFNLQPVGPGVNQSFVLQQPATTITLRLQRADVAVAGTATVVEMVDAFGRQLIDARVPVGVRAQPASGDLMFTTMNATTTATVTGGTLLAAPSSLFPGPNPVAAPLVAQPGSAALAAFPAGGHTLTLTINWQQAVNFDPAAFANPAAATAEEVRKVINRAAREAYMPVRAEAPEMHLRVAAATTDTEGAESKIAGAHLADLAVAPATVAAANRGALFNALNAFTSDVLVPSTQNFLYLRVTNSGNFAGPIRRRLFLVDHTVTPLTLTPIPIAPAARITQPVPAGGVDIIEVSWTPGALPNATNYVLAIVDRPGRFVDESGSLATFADLHSFATSRADVAYREFGQ